MEHPAAIAGKFKPLFGRFDNTERLAKSPPLLAHYTSISVMQKIIEHEQIWFSNPLFMTDVEEMRFGLFHGSRMIADQNLLRHAVETAARASILWQHFNRYYLKFQYEGAFDTYVFCLSEHRRDDNDGLLSMWRGYGGQGKGAAVVFDAGASTAVRGSPLYITKVRYASTRERVSGLREMLQQWADIIKAAGVPDELLHIPAKQALLAIIRYALTTKHSGFDEEEEWRVIYLWDVDRKGLLKQYQDYQITERGVEPKLKYTIGPIAGVTGPDLSLERILERIILGPSLSSQMARRSVVRMFEKMQKPQYIPKLHASTIPFRPVGTLTS